MSLHDSHERDLRKGRFSQPGYIYFLTTSTAERQVIFRSPENARIVLDSLAWLTRNRRLDVDAAVVMPDHLHFVGTLLDDSLETVMHSMKSYTAKELSKAGVEVPVWQTGFHDHALRSDEDYRVKVRYLLENPVRARLVQRVEEYPYLILPKWLKPASTQ